MLIIIIITIINNNETNNDNHSNHYTLLLLPLLLLHYYNDLTCVFRPNKAQRTDKEKRARNAVVKMAPRPPRNLKVIAKTCDQV